LNDNIQELEAEIQDLRLKERSWESRQIARLEAGQDVEPRQEFNVQIKVLERKLASLRQAIAQEQRAEKERVEEERRRRHREVHDQIDKLVQELASLVLEDAKLTFIECPRSFKLREGIEAWKQHRTPPPTQDRPGEAVEPLTASRPR
jgi:hypothetical protein